MYRRLAEIAGEYLSKGSKVYVEGKLQTRKWQDDQGQDRYITEVVVYDMQLLDGAKTKNHHITTKRNNVRSPEMLIQRLTIIQRLQSSLTRTSRLTTAFPFSD